MCVEHLAQDGLYLPLELHPRRDVGQDGPQELSMGMALCLPLSRVVEVA